MQLTSQPVLVDILYPKNLASTTTGRIAREIILLVGFASFVTICAQIIIQLPFTTVPITGQTFGVLLAGGALGAWRGAGALTLYLIAGLFLPIYAPSSASSVIGDGTIQFLFPWNGNSGLLWDMSSGGYIVGFVLAAWAAGIFARKGWYQTPWNIGGLIISNSLIYVPGLLWLAFLISSNWIHPAAGVPLSELILGGDTLEKTLIGGLYPFILGDLLKLYLAALALPAAWIAVTKFKGNSH